MPYVAYKLLHYAGLFLLFTSLGGLCAARFGQGQGAEGERWLKLLHGMALLMAFVAGFGMLARLGQPSPASWPFWIWLKLAIWTTLGAAPVLIKRAERWAGLLLVVLPLIGLCGALLVLYKPGV
jgi:hypothetical protein